ncbi:hypothetical protein SSPS47_09100 [Streptomyces sp. S4.7]|nr:hypothetical protein SSPS47_09100 [Streptomyces sp. S4.7]
MLLRIDVTFGVVVAVLLVAAAGTAALTHLGRGREIATAGVRAALQLGAVSLVIGWVVESLPALLVFVVLMYVVAVRTAGRRITPNGTWWWAAVPLRASRRTAPAAAGPAPGADGATSRTRPGRRRGSGSCRPGATSP